MFVTFLVNTQVNVSNIVKTNVKTYVKRQPVVYIDTYQDKLVSISCTPFKLGPKDEDVLEYLQLMSMLEIHQI